MKIYRVGGSVRDELLGLPVADDDFVVVGSDAEELVRLGFRPVGKDFPVFLHPRTNAEYALARTERKTARGYKGFSVYAAPDVTLEQDLARRDLTINAIARAEDGTLIDPFNGAADLKAGILRHVSPAFVEDPVRILRLARFAARFEFAIAPETLELMREMVVNGEVDHLVPERAWQELSRGLMERRPSRMLSALRDCGALARVLPEIDALFAGFAHSPETNTGAHLLLVIDYAAAQRQPLTVRFASMSHDLGTATTPPLNWSAHVDNQADAPRLLDALCKRLRVPANCRDLARLVVLYRAQIHRAETLTPDALVELLERTDAFRRSERFDELLAVCACDFHGRPEIAEHEFPPQALLIRAREAASNIDASAIARTTEPAGIAAAIHSARVQAVQEQLRR